MIRVTSTGSLQPDEVPRKGLGTMIAYRLLQDFASPSLIDQGENISIEHDTVVQQEPPPVPVEGYCCMRVFLIIRQKTKKRSKSMSGKMKTLLRRSFSKPANTTIENSAMKDVITVICTINSRQKDNFVAPKGEVVVSFATLPANPQSTENSWFLCMKLSTDDTTTDHNTGYIPSQFLEKISHDDFVNHLRSLSNTGGTDFGMSTMNRSQNIEKQLRATTLGIKVIKWF